MTVHIPMLVFYALAAIAGTFVLTLAAIGALFVWTFRNLRVR